MKRLGLSVLLIATASIAVACGSPTTPTPPPTTAPTVTPTANFKATEGAIVAHVFATLTASAPTATRAPIVVPATTAPKPTNTPRPAAPRPTNTRPLPAAPSTPKPTVDPYLAQIPKGMGGVLLSNFIGTQDATFTINGQMYSVPSNGKKLVVVAPGTYTYSVVVPGIAEVSKSDVMTITAGEYVSYSIAINQ